MAPSTLTPDPEFQPTEGQTAAVEEAAAVVGIVTAGLHQIDRELEVAVENRDGWTAAQLLAALKRIGDEHDVTFKEGRRAVRPILTAGQLAAPGVILEKDYGKDRSAWRSEALLHHVLPILIEEALTNDGTLSFKLDRGEVHDLARALEPLLLAVFRPDWKVGSRGKPGKVDEHGEIVGREDPTGLRAVGVDPQDWCIEATRGTVTVRLVTH